MEHRDEYLAARADFESAVAKFILSFSASDPTIASLTPRDCIYRFYRDTRFSNDKSPYKRHFGAYICKRGKKSLSGGYYLHVEPGQCMLAVGTYWLPTNILTSCRNAIMGDTDLWLEAVRSPRFLQTFGEPGEGQWETSDKGFGLSMLKTCPAGFPRDYEHLKYLRMKDYCAWHRVDDDFFGGDSWLEHAAEVFLTAKPMLDFINDVVDDYE